MLAISTAPCWRLLVGIGNKRDNCLLLARLMGHCSFVHAVVCRRRLSSSAARVGGRPRTGGPVETTSRIAAVPST